MVFRWGGHVGDWERGWEYSGRQVDVGMCEGVPEGFRLRVDRGDFGRWLDYPWSQ